MRRADGRWARASGTGAPAALDTINRDLGTMTFVITHNMVIADLVDEALRFRDGQISRARHKATRTAPLDLRC